MSCLQSPNHVAADVVGGYGSGKTALLERTLADGNPGIDLDDRLELARQQLARVTSAAYLEELVGTIGADPALG